MGNELNFEGKKYISAIRASDLYGYSSDYLGQLCRKNILDYRRVGRTWYINEDSIIAHKVAASSAQRGRIPGLKNGEPIFDGKKYISTSRAAKIADYSTDYISQLCRRGLLECRKVGKSWFVSEESLQAHQEAANIATRGRIPMYQKDFEVESFNGGAGVAAIPTPELSFRSFHQAAINFLDRKEEQRQTSAFTKKVVGSVLMVVLLLIFVVPTVFGDTSSFIKTYQQNVIASVTYSTHIFESIGQHIDDAIAAVVNGVYERVTRINSFFALAGQRFGRSMFGETKTDSNKDKTGLVVVPAADAETNDAVKEYVKNNFSDETEIVPDETGNSGLIKPIFKNQSDQEYVYVMVPVKEGDGP